MNLDEVEAMFTYSLKRWQDALQSEHGLVGKLDDTEVRKVVSDTGSFSYREVPVADSEKCLVKRMWDEYVTARDTLLTFYKSGI